MICETCGGPVLLPYVRRKGQRCPTRYCSQACWHRSSQKQQLGHELGTRRGYRERRQKFEAELAQLQGQFIGPPGDLLALFQAIYRRGYNSGYKLGQLHGPRVGAA